MGNNRQKGTITQGSSGSSVKKVTQLQVEQFEGPIPHPELIREYEQICPGFAERFMVMAENQSKHRIETEKKIVAASTRESLLGQILAFILTSGLIGGSIFLFYNKMNIQGAASFFAAMATIIVPFLPNIRSRK